MSVSFKDNSESAVRDINAAVTRALAGIGNAAEGYAKNLCPVDTGHLRQSIGHAVKDNTVYVGTNVEYAPYVEFGTGPHCTLGGGTLVRETKAGPVPFSGNKAQPFLKPAIADHTGEFMDYLISQLK